VPRKTGIAHISEMETKDAKSGDLNVIIETPKGSGAKFDYDVKYGVFKLGGMLPQGMTFPYSFGFIPRTMGADGDPLDVLVLMEEPAFTGCLVHSRLIGVIEAEQTDEDGKSLRNDRLIAVAAHSREHAEITSLKQLPGALTGEIEHFFTSYNEVRGKKFKPLGHFGAKRAAKLVAAGARRYRKS
jgi:inorganic pyrophosphatase